MANNYEIDYEDERFQQVNTDKDAALSELEQTYAGMIGESDKYYQAQIDASKQWADKQSQLQQEQTDFTIEQIEQQKDQAHKDYIKEQSGAYVDWRKQSNEYGTEAEKMASAGLANTGFSESSQVSMYNTYQNRLMTARESYNQAVLNYNNSIKDARLQNNSVLAEIAYNALQQQLELSLQGFQYKNNLIQEQANKKMELDNTYYQRWQDVLNQINHENAFAEEIRQYEQNYQLQTEQLALQAKELDESIRQFEKNYELKVKEYNESIRQFNEEIARLKKKDEREYQLEIQNLELKKAQMAEQKRQFEEQAKIEKLQLEEEKRQFDAQMKAQQAKDNAKTTASSRYSSSNPKTNVKAYSVASSKNASPGVQKTSSGQYSYGGMGVNMQSVLSLGYGPISNSKLSTLIKQGKVTPYKKNGQIYVKESSAWKSIKSIIPGFNAMK